MPKAIIYANTLSERFWRRTGHNVETNVRSLALFRILFGLFFLLIATPYTAWLASVPQAFFDPPYLSFANLFSSFPPKPVFYSLDALTIILLGCITLGIKARWSTLLFFIVGVIGNTFAYSLGKIDHSFLSLVLALCMSFSGWGTKYALIPDKPSRFDSVRLSLSLFAVLVAFGMFTAGFLKALYWIDFNVSTSGFLRWFYGGYYNLGRTELLSPFILQVPTPLFELADYLAVGFELSGFIFLLAGRRAWLLWLLTAAAFHLVNVLALNIIFNTHFLVYLVFVDFTWLSKFLTSKKESRQILKVGTTVFTSLLVVTHLGYQVAGEKFSFLTLFNPDAGRAAALNLSLVIWGVALAVLASDLFSAKARNTYSFPSPRTR